MTIVIRLEISDIGGAIVNAKQFEWTDEVEKTTSIFIKNLGTVPFIIPTTTLPVSSINPNTKYALTKGPS